jgi:hypothetical protein
MRLLRSFFRLGLSSMVLLLLACVISTQFSSVWKDEAYQEHPEKILIISEFKNPENRRIFEESFVKEMKNRGQNGEASYSIVSKPSVSDIDDIASLAKEAGADAVLVNRPLGTRIGKSAGADYMDVYIDTQTDVYDMKSNKLILSISAQTRRSQKLPIVEQIRSYVRDVVAELSRLGLF